MSYHPLIRFNRQNRRLILALIGSHLLWSGAIFTLWISGQQLDASNPWLSATFIAFQLFAAAQLLLPALLLHPEERNRGFYLFWGIILLMAIWLINQIDATTAWQPLLTTVKSALLLLVATVTAAALARYVQRLWEIVPICIVMTLADFSSWLAGPTASFSQQIEHYYLTPGAKAPLIDMVLIKLAFPGTSILMPVFGISDWIMVVFFAIVARRHGINDNLIGSAGETLARHKRLGRYLPVSVVALFTAIVLAQSSGLFIPALPLIALTMLCWYALRLLWLRWKN